MGCECLGAAPGETFIGARVLQEDDTYSCLCMYVDCEGIRFEREGLLVMFSNRFPDLNRVPLR